MCFIFHYVFINIVHHDSTGKSKQLSILHNLNILPTTIPTRRVQPQHPLPKPPLKPSFNHRMPPNHPLQSIDSQEFLKNVFVEGSHPQSTA